MTNFKERYKDMIGNKFGRLTVVEMLNEPYYTLVSYGGPLIKCVCECGEKVDVPRVYLIRNKRKSCGCLAIEKRQ